MQDYESFVKKFEPKKTSDDCYTPPNIYEVVKKWAIEFYKIDDDAEIVRPFYPGGDFENYNYPENCIVIDNPPFSIISKICKFYREKNIKYLLFAPSLTLLSTNRGEENYVCANISITYENGARISTSFVTNMGDYKILVNSDLIKKLKSADDENRYKKTKKLPKYINPDNVLDVRSLCYYASHECDFAIKKTEPMLFIRSLDSQKKQGKSLYGGGFLVSDKAAADKAAADKAAADKAAADKAAAVRWELSEREKEIINRLGME